MPAIASPVLDLSLPHPRSDGAFRIATLGPKGTSSEAAAHYLAEYLSTAWADRPGDHHWYPVRLFDQYELAAESVLDGSSTLLLVANAYHAVSTFYMDPRLSVQGVYCFDTPQYGIATPAGGSFPDGPMTIASHPAPIPIIDQLLEPRYSRAATVVQYNSTSAAAAAAANGSTDAALTTAPAADEYGLVFVTRTRTIRMVWSVFGRSISTTPTE